MKKRLLSALLILAIALALAMPAFAEGEPNPAMPEITAQPVSCKVNLGSGWWSLEVVAEIPNGDPIGYQWYQVSPQGDIPVGPNHQRIDRNLHDIDEWDMIKGVKFYCVVYNSNDSTAEEGPHRAVSEAASIRARYIVVNSILAILYLPIELMARWLGKTGAFIMLPYFILYVPIMGILFLMF